MNDKPYQREIKAIKLLQGRSSQIHAAHVQIGNDLDSIKAQLASLADTQDTPTLEASPDHGNNHPAVETTRSLASVDLASIYAEADARYTAPLGIEDILSDTDWIAVEQKLGRHVQDFNRRYSLDAWDYAIAGSCGLFAAMIDLLWVKAPPKPTVAWTKEVDGIFNQWVQESFNKILPPDLSKALSKAYSIGAPDSSVWTDLIGAPPKVLNPINHRLWSLAHYPILGFIFGVLDMLRGTCTVVVNGQISSFPSTKGPTDGTVFQLLGRMLGHLLSDVNAPSANGNRGMGLPAPFMGLLRMFEGIPVGDSDFGKQIEWLYVNGYDFRQFVVSSIPMAIMEVMMRACYVAKQMKVHGASFGESLLDTVPLRMHPRFRMMLALAYGTSSAVNAGKVYVTQNMLNVSYASWMGLAWNGTHALKWALHDRYLKLWEGIEAGEIADLEKMVVDLDGLHARASQLPG